MKRNKTLFYGVCAVFMILTACTSHYQLVGVSHTRIVVDNRYDATPDETAAVFLAPYKQKVDSLMGPVVGKVAHNMAAIRPESDLSNLLSDILIWASKNYNEKPDIGIYNMGGIRAALSQGDVTYGDVLAIAPFENKICFLTMTGENLLELFQEMAAKGGEGVSHGVEMVITQDGKLLSARLNGKPIRPEKEYRIATIDYLAQGNDGFTAFKKATKLVAPSEEHNNTRYIIIDYFKEKMARGESVSTKVEGRTRVM